MEDGPLHTFSRVAKRDPPTDREYLTPQDKLGPPADDESAAKKRSWDALSAFDTEERARRQAKQFTHLGGRIARYDIPE